jgi:hypothetical protein
MAMGRERKTMPQYADAAATNRPGPEVGWRSGASAGKRKGERTVRLMYRRRGMTGIVMG